MIEIVEKNAEIPILGTLLPKVTLQASGPVSQHCRLSATNDWEAICDWLAEHDHNPGTYRIYKREARRLLFWCQYKQGTYFSKLSKDDLHAYLKFLKAPAKGWCTSRKALRNGEWKPFIGPLGTAAYRTAVQSINSLLQYLTDANYLSFNPMKLINKHKTLTSERERQKYKVWERILEDDEWQAIQQVLKELPSITKEERESKERTIFLISILYFLGLRTSEVVNSTWGAFRKIRDEWWFFVEGKGGKLGHVPVTSQLLNCIRHYRLQLGKPLLPQQDETEPLLLTTRKTQKSLSLRQIRDLVKNIGILAALKFPHDLNKQQKLKKFSPHWLRHLFASHLDRAGISPTIIKANLRHSSLTTSQIYIHANDASRFMETQKLQMDLFANNVFVEKASRLQLIVKPKPLNNSYKFDKLTEAIESQVLQGFSWEKQGDHSSSSFNYEKFSSFSLPINIEYWFNTKISIDMLEQFKQSVLKEADIRGFNCEVIIY